ncbi:MAG: hypothetical protein DMF59_12030 [Acidobacteria bacterium]|nr:MAG: hypothetical protein DMF59_12030 [Acidobacteriota bacterium]
MFLLAAWMLVSAPRERAVLIYPRERVWFRRAFHTSHQRDLQRQLQQRYAVEVHDQVATDDQLFAIDIRGAKLLVLSAHGCPYGMSFNGKHQRTLDGSDQARLSAFFSQLAPDATIILQSCYTGLGFARTVKKAAGPNRHVIAADGEIPRDGVVITSVFPLDVAITCRDGGRPRDCKVRL